MKLVVFAHTPPPFHGQSFMVESMLTGFRNKLIKTITAADSNELVCYHVNVRLSDDLEDVGRFRFGKVMTLLYYVFQAIVYRFRFGARNFYYVPAPGKRSSLYRDWIVMGLCRPFFSRLIFHWHAVGLAGWLTCDACLWERWVTRRLLGFPDLSLTLASSLSDDATYLQSKRIQVVPNGIPDPCPEFEELILPFRRANLARRRQIFEEKSAASDNRETYRVVFLAHCTREKGLFDALRAIALANQDLDEQRLPLRMHLTVAGAFLHESERQEFDSWQKAHRGQVNYVGFLAADAKRKLLQKSDCLCFPTFYLAEGQPVSIIEAMAFGLTIVASAWRGILELLPKNYPFLCSERDPSVLASTLIESVRADLAKDLRLRYCETFTEECYLNGLANALQQIWSPSGR